MRLPAYCTCTGCTLRHPRPRRKTVHYCIQWRPSLPADNTTTLRYHYCSKLLYLRSRPWYSTLEGYPRVNLLYDFTPLPFECYSTAIHHLRVIALQTTVLYPLPSAYSIITIQYPWYSTVQYQGYYPTLLYPSIHPSSPHLLTYLPPPPPHRLIFSLSILSQPPKCCTVPYSTIHYPLPSLRLSST